MIRSLLCILFALFLYFPSNGQANQSPLVISQLAGDFYVFTTYKILDGNPFPANGMYLVTEAGVVMFGTPWDSTQFQPLLDSIKARHHKKAVLCISTHFHDDRTAGLDFHFGW